MGPDSTQTCRRRWPADKHVVIWCDGQASGLQSCVSALCLCTPQESRSLSTLLLDMAEQGAHHDHQVVTAGEDAVHHFLQRHCGMRDKAYVLRVGSPQGGRRKSMPLHVMTGWTQRPVPCSKQSGFFASLPVGRSGIAGTPSTWSRHQGLPAASLPLIDWQSGMLLPA